MRDTTGKEGELLMCDKCPAAYHMICSEPPIDPSKLGDGEWLCVQCRPAPKVCVHTHFSPGRHFWGASAASACYVHALPPIVNSLLHMPKWSFSTLFPSSLSQTKEVKRGPWSALFEKLTSHQPVMFSLPPSVKASLIKGMLGVPMLFLAVMRSCWFCSCLFR